MVGSLSDFTCFSFYATKTLTTGEGGMICTEDDAWAERCRIMALHGISKDAWKRYTAEGSWYYEIIAPGYKYNMTDVAAAMGACATAQGGTDVAAAARDRHALQPGFRRAAPTADPVMTAPIASTPGTCTCCGSTWSGCASAARSLSKS